MLGEQIGMDKGKVTGRRVLEGVNGVVVETSIEGMGKLLGVDATGFATYSATPRPDGSVLRNGQGVLMGKNGERCSWTANGVGSFTNDGGIKFRGAICYTTMSEGWKKLNAIAGVYEHNVDANGVTESKVWEWR